MSILKLSKAILMGGKEISELTFRKPTGRDVRCCGLPTKSEITPGGAQLQHVDTEAAARYISELAGIPPSSVDLLDPADFVEAVSLIASFFNKAAAPSSTAATSSPASSTESTPSS